MEATDAEIDAEIAKIAESGKKDVKSTGEYQTRRNLNILRAESKTGKAHIRNCQGCQDS